MHEHFLCHVNIHTIDVEILDIPVDLFQRVIFECCHGKIAESGAVWQVQFLGRQSWTGNLSRSRALPTLEEGKIGTVGIGRSTRNFNDPLLHDTVQYWTVGLTAHRRPGNASTGTKQSWKRNNGEMDATS